MKRFDVVAIGNANIDLIFKVPRLPKNDDKVVGKKLAETLGGTVANSACVMSQLGLKTASLSAVGTDRNAKLILAGFCEYNVETCYIDVIPGLEANMAVIMLDDSREKGLIYAPGDDRYAQKTQYEAALADCRAIYTMPGNVEKFITFAQLAHQHQALVIVDIEPHIADTPEKFKQILTYADIVFFNLDGFQYCSGRSPSPEVLKILCQQYNLTALIVTRGAQGAIAANQSEVSDHPGFKVPVIDTTGAGDTFNAAFVYSILQNNPTTLFTTLVFACACAAISVGYVGARGAIPDKETVDRFIHKNTLQK